LARMKDERHYYQFEIRSTVSKPAIQSWDISKYDGNATMLVSGIFVNPINTMVQIRLVLSGTSIQAYSGKNGVYSLLGKVADGTYNEGGMGLRTWDTSGSAFGSIAVTSPSQSAPSSPAPSTAPTTSPAGPVATFDGCPVFTPGDYYNADITNAAADPNSANYLASVESVDNTGFQDSLGIEPVNIATNSTPLLKVHPDVSYHTFPVPYPWQSGFKIEDSSDEHYVAINTQICHLYEAYGTAYRSGVLSAYSGKDYDLRQPFKIGGGVMASGLSYFAGAVRLEDIATGVHHALNINVWSNALCNCFTAPAAASDDVPYKGKASSYQLPYGAHLRLAASYDCSNWGPQSGAICAAMKHYGLYVSDTDGHYANNNKLFFVDPTSGSWNSGDLSALNQLRFSDFEVLKIGKIQ
jgi:hypothetical protein